MSPERRVREEAIEKAAQDRVERVSRLRAAMQRLDSRPELVEAARRLRQRLPGDEQFGDPLSVAGLTPVQVIARGVSAFGVERDSVLQELGLAGLQVWQSVSESVSRSEGPDEMAILFTDLVGFSSWALEAGDGPALELLREVGSALEAGVLAYDGRIVKRLGDGLMATFLAAQQAVDAALDGQDAIARVEVDGHRPQMRAGVHWGSPRKLGGDYLGVDVNIAARVGDAAKAGQVMVSDVVLESIATKGLKLGRAKRLKAEGIPRDLQVVCVARE